MPVVSQRCHAYLFWEEAFSELMAREAGFPSLGFPLYGTEPDIAAASLGAEALPVDQLIREHRALNFRCMAQAYVERISFMMFLRERFGLAPLVEIAWADQPLEVAHIEQVLGTSMDVLVAEHERRVAAAGVTSGAAEAMASFREKTPIRFLPMCPR